MRHQPQPGPEDGRGLRLHVQDLTGSPGVRAVPAADRPGPEHPASFLPGLQTPPGTHLRSTTGPKATMSPKKTNRATPGEPELEM